MLQWLKSLFHEEITAEDFRAWSDLHRGRSDRPLFGTGDCLYGKYVKAHGVLSRQFQGTRHDN